MFTTSLFILSQLRSCLYFPIRKSTSSPRLALVDFARALVASHFTSLSPNLAQQTPSSLHTQTHANTATTTNPSESPPQQRSQIHSCSHQLQAISTIGLAVAPIMHTKISLYMFIHISRRLKLIYIYLHTSVGFEGILCIEFVFQVGLLETLGHAYKIASYT